MARLKKPVVRGEGPVRRVSLEIPLDLWKKAKLAAFEAGEPLRDLILAGLRSELDRRAQRARDLVRRRHPSSTADVT